MGKGAEIEMSYAPSDAAHASGGAESTPRRVLVVDDDPAILRGTERALRREYLVRTASSAHEALQLLEAGFRFDVIVCDVWMPGTNGVAFHEVVSRASPAEAEKILFVTGGGLPDALQSFLAGKPFVRKPWKKAELVAAIETICAKHPRAPERTVVPWKREKP